METVQIQGFTYKVREYNSLFQLRFMDIIRRLFLDDHPEAANLSAKAAEKLIKAWHKSVTSDLDSDETELFTYGVIFQPIKDAPPIKKLLTDPDCLITTEEGALLHEKALFFNARAQNSSRAQQKSPSASSVSGRNASAKGRKRAVGH